MNAGVVIVGAGQAGADLSSALRQSRYQGRIVIIGDEPYVPYRRPPLSKTYLGGEATLDSLFLKSRETYAKHDIECLTGVRAIRIERDARRVLLSDGRSVAYDKLALTTGGRPRTLDVPGGSLSNVYYVRTIDDIISLKAAVRPGRRLVIVGGGYIGLEAAAVAVKLGLAVTVIEAQPRILARVTAPALSNFYLQVHHAHGVDIRTGVGVRALRGIDAVDSVELEDGSVVEADLVIVGVGLVPNVELAAEAGLECDNGIVVDQFALTSDVDIVAAGDCTQHDNGFLRRRLRLESVPHAIEHAKVAAASVMGKRTPYLAVPWFWSDQYDLKLQMVGLSQGHDRCVIRGEPEMKSFCAFYLKDGIIIAADAVNRPTDFLLAKRLVAERRSVVPDMLSNETISLKELLPHAA